MGAEGTDPGGTISLTGIKGVSLTNGTILTADNTYNGDLVGENANGGTILINGGAKFTSQHSTISAQSVHSELSQAHGGTIHIEANKVSLTDTQVTTSVSGGPQTVGGHITVDAKNVTLKNSRGAQHWISAGTRESLLTLDIGAIRSPG